MSRGKYWKERMEALEEEQYRKTSEYYDDLQKQFRIAQNRIQMDIELWYDRLADNNGISYAAARRFLKEKELDEFKWTVKEYIRHGKENAVNHKWVTQLENASARVHINYLESMKIQIQQHAEVLFRQYENGTAEFLKDTYTENFYHSAYEIAKGCGVGTNLARIGERQIDIVLTRPWAQDGKVFSDRIWENKDKLVRELHTELTQCIIRGEHPDKAAARLADSMGVKSKQAKTLVYTESAAVAMTAQKDCFQELDVEEFEVVETLDSYTCDFCRDMDGKHFPMSQYEIGITAPPFHPRCRGCTSPYFDDEFTIGEQRAARKEDGDTYYVPADMSYREWEKRYAQKDDDETEEVKTPVEKNYKKEYTGRTKEKLESIANDNRDRMPDYTAKPSKWSGNIIVDNSLIQENTLGRKEWSCDITLVDSVDDGIIWHEMLHSCSASYYSQTVYVENQCIEEASVEFLKQQICKEKGIVQSFAYEELVAILEVINHRFAYGTDLEFSRQLFHVPLPDRYQWLEEKVDNSLRELGASFQDYNEVIGFVAMLKGGIDE